jgi:hypothetical protein
MARELRSRTYLWMGAGTLAIGIGAALASGTGVAQADSTSSGSPGPSKPGHHQAAAPPSDSTASPVKASATKKSTAAHKVAAKRGIVTSAVALHVAKADKATATATADNPTDVGQALAAQSQAIAAQGQEIAAQGQAIANEEKAFGAQVQNFLTPPIFIAVPTRGLVTEFYYGATSGVLLDFAQWTNRFASGLNGAAQGITSFEQAINSNPGPGGSLFVNAVSTAVTPIANAFTAGANTAAGASARFYVTAGAYEAGFIQNLPQNHPIITA